MHFEYDDTLAEKSGLCGSVFFLLICGVFDNLCLLESTLVGEHNAGSEWLYILYA